MDVIWYCLANEPPLWVDYAEHGGVDVESNTKVVRKEHTDEANHE